MRRVLTVFLFFVLTSCMGYAALAEEALIVTPGGRLNMRKAANDKAKLVDTVPNNARVDVLEAGDVWSKITYKKKTGYVKTEFLKIPSHMAGKTVYADEGTLLLLETADKNARIVDAVGPQDSVEVVKVNGPWCQVKHGDAAGYVATSHFTLQLEKASVSMAWAPEKAVVNKNCKLRKGEASSSETLAALKAGDNVTVTWISGKSCLVQANDVWGFVPAASLRLTGPEDSDAKAGSISPNKAVQSAQEALQMNFKSFAKEKLYAQTQVVQQLGRIKGPLYHCGFFNDKDQYVFGAWVNAKKGTVVFSAMYSGFAAPSKEKTLLPDGQIQVEISSESLKVGDVVDISVLAWTDHQCAYSLAVDGKTIVKGEPGNHFTAAYRPRQAGDYELTVTVTDAKGQSVAAMRSFQVKESKKAGTTNETVYSQKDGWWLDVKYRKSTMDHSGCAIFALSHALQRMGVTGSNTLPQNLAKTYALCLTPEGTNNDRLITTAAKDFGFTTNRILFHEEKEIRKLLKNGCLFTFSVARGHIALVSGISEDGDMVRIVDSAPQATFERIVNASMYYQMRSGSFRAALTLEDMPGSRWYLDTMQYGGLEYYLPMSYVAKRGVRLIQPAAK